MDKAQGEGIAVIKLLTNKYVLGAVALLVALAAASWDLQNTITELQHAKPKIIAEYKRVVVQTPLPDTCRIDADRLRGIQSAVSAAAAVR